MTHWEIAVLDADESSAGTRPVSGFDERTRRKESLMKADPCVALDCPICRESESLVVSLDYDSLETTRTLDPITAICVQCDIVFTKETRSLLRELCQPQLTPELTQATCQDYGLR